MSAPTPPAKYLRTNGIMQLNPEFKLWKESQGFTASTVPNAALALPVVTSMADHKALNDASVYMGEAYPLAESTTATLEMMQEPDICLAAGMTPATMTHALGSVLNKYEVPMGLMNKLMILSEYDALEFCIDDSGSMNMLTDALDPQQQPQTRWQEAHERLREIMEILAHVPFTQVVVTFLNRPDRIVLEREGRTPDLFLQDAYARIHDAFCTTPQGSTPTWEKMQESFALGEGKSIARYFFGDGLPNGGEPIQRQITEFLKHRPHPSMNPVTFISCTNEDDQVEWMKSAEEVAPYCAESDDFLDETREVMLDQGEALPFTKGFYLICQLVAAMNPDDLDAMDESVPFTKATLDNLMGIQYNNETYKHYFDCFVAAQQRRVPEEDYWGNLKPGDNLKKTFHWRQHYHEFLTTPVAKDIPAVKHFKAQLKSLDSVVEQKREAALPMPKGVPIHHAADPCCSIM